MTKVNDRGRRTALLVAVGAGAVAGALIRGVLPPFALDDPFWRAFWSGPPAAGLFAVLAAVIAFFPAYRSTRIARESAARQHVEIARQSADNETGRRWFRWAR